MFGGGGRSWEGWSRALRRSIHGFPIQRRFRPPGLGPTKELVIGERPTGLEGLTTRIDTVLRVAQTRTSKPMLNTTVEATFLYVLRRDRHSRGIGIKIR